MHKQKKITLVKLSDVSYDFMNEHMVSPSCIFKIYLVSRFGSVAKYLTADPGIARSIQSAR